MRTSLCVIAALGSVVASALVSGVGCGSLPDDCGLRLRCSPNATGTGGGGGGTPTSCIPSENTTAIGDDCGIFVSDSLGVDGADRGSKAKPFKTLAAAIARAKATTMRVYACAEPFSGPVTIDAGIELYGSLDCAKDWSYNGGQTKTTLTAAADEVPLTMAKSTSGGKVLDFAITAADSAKMDGGSSIAVVADQARASLVRCDIIAGNGTAGLVGITPTDPWPVSGKDPDLIGNDGADACAMGAGQTPGGLPKDNKYCPAASGGPLGGSGGIGAQTTGNNGDLVPPTPQTAKGGEGQPSADPTWSCATVGQGATGADGAPGMPGAGASGDMSLGAIDATGYHGVAGKDGTDAQPGQGGGGGGGAKGKVGICGGASGGGGGAGGCGGHGGKGGGAGGASIGVISLAADLTFDTVSIKVGKGGNGGDGGDGEFGGHGGNGGNGGVGNMSSPACNGGNGGNGGQGGKGGGGRGGHAIGIAYTGALPPTAKTVTFVKGTAGIGGQGADMTTAGDPGVQADTQIFP